MITLPANIYKFSLGVTENESFRTSGGYLAMSKPYTVGNFVLQTPDGIFGGQRNADGAWNAKFHLSAETGALLVSKLTAENSKVTVRDGNVARDIDLLAIVSLQKAISDINDRLDRIESWIGG